MRWSRCTVYLHATSRPIDIQDDIHFPFPRLAQFPFLYPLFLPVYLAWNTLPVKAYRRTYLLKRVSLLVSLPILLSWACFPFRFSVDNRLFVLEVIV